MNDHKRQELTEREKAVLFWAAAKKVKDWKKIYLLSRERAPDTYDKKGLPQAASKWKYQAKVQDFYNDCLKDLDEEKKRLIEEAAAPLNIAEGGEAEGEGEVKMKNSAEKKVIGIDFTDSENALRELNKLANDIQDPAKKADAIILLTKLIASTRPEEDKAKEVQRFYTPLNCKDCILYKEAQEQ